MGNVIKLKQLEDFSADELQGLVDSSPRASNLRSAVQHIIKAIHGLPDVLDCDLRQVRVYVGRAGATSTHIRQRWQTRFDDFEEAPSAHAMVVVRAATDRIKDQAWETTAIRLVNVLKRHGALCCANAIVGGSGLFADTEDTALYLVAHTRKGPAGDGVRADVLNAAIVELLNDDELNDKVAREVRLIASPEVAYEHSLIEPESYDDQDDYQGTFRACRSDGCHYRAKPGNYGFCGHHR